MRGTRLRKYVLDTNCFIDASRNPEFRDAFDAFCAEAAPGLYLSSVVGAELRAGAGRGGALLEREVLAPYARRQRILTPSAQSWHSLGTALATLTSRDGLVLANTRRSFVFDILIAHSCREAGATLVSANTRDMTRIAKVFAFEFVAPFPTFE
ncbi:MAG TPA: type II toxin-antitoxin system VapC family toxin [Gemmatimonadaceae bacterium]|jgi:predicted nucleic acid-binding protein